MNCPACASDILGAKGATVSPFVAMRVWGKGPHRTTLRECAHCGLAWFDPGLSNTELKRLYDDYRGQDYQVSRQAFEPWYTPAFNAALESEDLLALRRSIVNRILEEHLGFQPNKILDYGGDRGELVADMHPVGGCFVYDISEKPAVKSVTRLGTLKECATEEFDLVLCSNVLEHVSNPLATLSEIMTVAPRASVFIEVPIESPGSAGAAIKRCIQQCILTVTNPTLAAKLFKLGFVTQMHEHVTFYSENALAALALRVGYQIRERGSYPLTGTKIGPIHWRSRLAWLIARQS